MRTLIKDRTSCFIAFAFLGIVAIFVLSIDLPMLAHYHPNAITRNGVALWRPAPDVIRLGNGSGINISPRRSLGHFQRMWLQDWMDNSPYVFPKLSNTNSWAPHLGVEDATQYWTVYFVNPRMSGAEDRVFRLLASDELGEEEIDSLIAQDYVYLGYIVRGHEEAEAFAMALIDRSGKDLGADIVTPERIFYRLAQGVELMLLDDPSAEAEAEELRAALPVMVERIDTARGHPGDTCHVLFLDGHIEELPFGSRWPATQAFIDTFPAPTI